MQHKQQYPYRITTYHSKYMSKDLENINTAIFDYLGPAQATSKFVKRWYTGLIPKDHEPVWAVIVRVLGKERNYTPGIRNNQRTRLNTGNRIKVRWCFKNEEDLAMFLLVTDISKFTRSPNA